MTGCELFRTPGYERADAALHSTDPDNDRLTAVAERLMSSVPEWRAEALLELLHVVGAAQAGLLTAVDADGRHLIVATLNYSARVAASIAGELGRTGRIRGAMTRSLMSATGAYVGALYLEPHFDVASNRLAPRAMTALDSLTPHAAAVATVVSRRSRLGLTHRERDILCAISSGYTNAEISQRESVSVRTVTTHVESIFRKLGVHNRVQAARVAMDCCLQRTDTPTPHYSAGLSSGLTAAQGRAAS